MKTLQHLREHLRTGNTTTISRLQLAEGLREFPPEILELASTLEILDLSNNRLSSLPADFGKLQHLQVLFLSNNDFDHLPEVISQCPRLSMIGFKANRIAQVSARALPRATRWLILTDNRIETLPDTIGSLVHLQKLMLAGNRLRELPPALAHCTRLQLLRISANQLTHLPDWLLAMPALAWLAFAGNPLGSTAAAPLPDPSLPDPSLPGIKLPCVKLADVELHNVLGQGASGVIHRASWIKPPPELAEPGAAIAVKLFKSAVTSDGYPADELQASLRAGQHPNLVKVVAHLNDDPQQGLVMALIPPEFTNLGQPPSFATCTRDTFPADQRLTPAQAGRIATQIDAALQHLHQRGISHGDLYAHNILVNDNSDVLFGDFGAASLLSELPAAQQQAIKTIERRALAYLREDLAQLVGRD